MSTAVYAGSFDPMTLGHIDIVNKALTIFDKVIIGVAVNSAKRSLLPVAKRISLANELFADREGRVSVAEIPGLTATFAKEAGATALVRGLRNAADLESEISLAALNRQLCGLETVFLIGEPALSHISSSAVKELARYHADITAMVPPAVAAAVLSALKARPAG
jgi:pantetheine-phosphate adenylyltransferase